MKIAVASPPFPTSIADGLTHIEHYMRAATSQQAEIICFPESYIPGYPNVGAETEATSAEKVTAALEAVAALAKQCRIAVILPMDWHEEDRLLNVAQVISANGELLGYQSKNQLDPSEDAIWSAGTERKLFTINGVKIGIAICHEGFRYPESVRWAAVRGAQIVFHPHCTGSNQPAFKQTEWNGRDNAYYEQAMMMRARENTIFLAVSNYGFAYPESASAVIDPEGRCLAHTAYGRPDLVVVDIELQEATGLLAGRFNPALYK